jgi:hypothetical protein
VRVSWYGTLLLCGLGLSGIGATGCGAATGANPDAHVPAPGAVTEPAAAGAAARGVPADATADGARMVPAGYGSLRQDDITVSLRAGAVMVKVTPMDEATIRLLAPDTYARLSALRESRRAEVERTVSRSPEFFLVSFFSYQPDQVFQPENVQLVYQARLLRPASIVPVSGGWGRQRLGQQETQTAVYAFDGPVDYEQTFTVRYDQVDSTDWQRIVPLLETERGRVLTRSGG